MYTVSTVSSQSGSIAHNKLFVSNGHTSYWENGAAWPLYSDHNTQTFVLSPFTSASTHLIIITFLLCYFESSFYLISKPKWSFLSSYKEMCLHAFQEHKWVFCNFLWFCLDSQINMFCHHNEITLWINDSICMAFVGSNFNILEHYTIPCVFNIQTVCSLASAVVETNVCLSTSHNLLHLFHWSLGETCQIQSNKIHFYFYYPFILVFIFHS